ncbi:heterodisulfide reductase-related iron-sulfur binding cluster [Desulfocastanea catecholica]
MEATREIYWNVGHGWTTLVPMYLFTAAAIGVLVYGGMQRLKIYRLGKPIDRTDDLWQRIVDATVTVLGQAKVIRVRWPGLAHGAFFWSFFVLFIGTALIVLQADFTDLLFDIKFLKGTFYKIFSVSLDVAGLVALLGMGALFVRRYFIQSGTLESTWNDAFMHGLLFLILLTGFVIEGARMAVTELGTSLAYWSPVGLVFAKAMSGMDATGLQQLHAFTWWFHLLLVMVFIISIPFTKFRHMVTIAVNMVLADRGPTGKLQTIELENEEVESFGAVQLTDLTWKDIFDTDACIKCQRCQDRCPAYATDKPLSPMKIIDDMGRVAFSPQPDANLIETIGKDALWACTTCRACQDICPAGIEHVGKIVEMRRNLVLMEGEFPGDEVMTAMEQTEVNGNPLGMGYASRGDWAENLGIKTLAEEPEADILYFVGCYASFDKRNIAVARSFVSLCQAAGVKVGILGKEEKCCGEPMRKMGNEYLYQSQAMENIEVIKAYGVKKIVTTCPHCYNTLQKDYRDLGLEAEVVSYVVFLEQLITSGRLQLKAEGFSCTYHDSCYLGRHNGIYQAPRALIAKAGGVVTEMDRNRDQAFCCSAGGGRILAEEKLGSRINIHRVQMAAAAKADVLISNCPFCLTMFEDGVKGAEVEESLRPRDIAEILAERIVQPSAQT